MELIQEYLDLQEPDFNTLYDEGRGTLSDQFQTLTFLYKNLQYETQRENVPVYSSGTAIPRMIQHGPRSTSIRMDIILDNDELYQLLQGSIGQRLKLATALFEADVITERINFHSLSFHHSDVRTDVQFSVIGEFNLKPITRKASML